MKHELLIAGVLVFFAVFVAVETVLRWWSSTRSAEAIRLRKRIALAGGDPIQESAGSMLRRRLASEGARSAFVARATSGLERLLVQSGSEWSMKQLYGFVGLGAAAGALISLALRLPMIFAAGAAFGAAAFPLLLLMTRRARRLKRFERQLPDALDLIGRALRSGHSLPTALKLAGEELAEPVGEELRLTSDEIALGSPQSAALERLALRVPSQDLSFFVIAVTIQRETGGNLAEVLDNIARIIRDRIKLFGKIRALSAEGRISATVLALLPFITAFVLYGINPGLMSLLWTEPSGIRMVQFGLVLIVVGIIWMRKVIRIHV